MSDAEYLLVLYHGCFVSDKRNFTFNAGENAMTLPEPPQRDMTAELLPVEHTFCGLKIIADPSVPDDMILVKDERGKVLLMAALSTPPAPVDVEEIKRMVRNDLMDAIPNSYSDNTMLNCIDLLAARGLLARGGG
jgi:hypothetical protein